MAYKNNTEWVVLVDTDDKVTGVMEKLKAHQEGVLHRAISVFVFNTNNQLLLQQRASCKYHSGGLWTNTCCSHPHEGETVYAAARRRLYQEMKMDCELSHKFSFLYRAELDNHLTEYEYDHVFFGVSDDVPEPNCNEVANWKYMSIHEIKEDIERHPELYTEWFKICFHDYFNQLFS